MNRVMKRSLIVALLLLCASCATRRPMDQSRSFDAASTTSLGRDIVPSVNFDFGSERVRYGDRWVLRNNALWMKAHPNAFVILEGHCDRRGDEEFNIELGDRRARNVRGELVRLGVASDSFAIVSYGESRAIGQKNSTRSFRNNRRVAFVVR
jgi:peptidoglycan-associated lipoprotein